MVIFLDQNWDIAYHLCVGHLILAKKKKKKYKSINFELVFIFKEILFWNYLLVIIIQLENLFL